MNPFDSGTAMNAHSTAQIQGWINSLQKGDPAARAELLASTCERLTELTRRMLKDYPRLRRWEQTDDVLQNALVRLYRALQDVTPPTVRDYYRFATLQIRRELLDLARHHFGPEGAGAHHASHASDSGTASGRTLEQPDATHDPAGLAAWGEFHEIVGSLPDDEREVFELLWYQELKQEEAAQLLGVSVPTIKRRWLAARLLLQERLKDKGASGLDGRL